jgi:hypothetical protein
MRLRLAAGGANSAGLIGNIVSQFDRGNAAIVGAAMTWRYVCRRRLPRLLRVIDDDLLRGALTSLDFGRDSASLPASISTWLAVTMIAAICGSVGPAL